MEMNTIAQTKNHFKKVLQYYFYVLLILSGLSSFAQTLPATSYRDYGFQKSVKKVEQLYYSIETDSIEKVEKITRIFNADGNIESYENESFLDDSWSKSIISYKRGEIYKEVWTHSNPFLNRTYSYEYDKQGRIIRENIEFKDGAKSYINFTYQDSLLKEIEANIDGIQSVRTRFYDIKNQLYKETHIQEIPGDTAIVTNYFYLADKEILSYVAPKNYFNATVYFNNMVELKFKLKENNDAQEKLWKGISRFDAEAPQGNTPFGLIEYSEQTMQFYQKNKEILQPFQMKIFLRNRDEGFVQEGDIKTEGEVDVKVNKVSGICFYKIEYTDGSIIGSTAFDKDTAIKMNLLLAEVDLL
jgi:hypothetical protein